MYVNSPVLLCSSYSTPPLAPLTDRNKPAVWAATPREAGWISRRLVGGRYGKGQRKISPTGPHTRKIFWAASEHRRCAGSKSGEHEDAGTIAWQSCLVSHLYFWLKTQCGHQNNLMVYKATLSEDQLETELKKSLQDLRQHLVESKKVQSAETLRFG